MIPKRGAYPAIDYLIEKLNCTEVVYITMTPKEQALDIDNKIRHLLIAEERASKMLEHIIPEAAKNDMSAYEWWTLVFNESHKLMEG